MKKKGKNGNSGKSEDAVFTVVIYEWTLVAEEAKATGEHGMQYVGQTNDPDGRKQDFYNENIDYSAPGSKIDKARHKFGTDKDKWKYKELHRRQYKSKDLCRKRGDELETEEIIKHDSVNKGFNGSYGRGMKGIHHKEESKRKMSEKKKGHTVDAPTRMKISKTQKKTWARRLKEKHKNTKKTSVLPRNHANSALGGELIPP